MMLWVDFLDFSANIGRLILPARSNSLGEWRGTSFFAHCGKVSPCPCLEKEVSNTPARTKCIRTTKYRFCGHRANLSKLKGLRNRESQSACRRACHH